MRSGVELRPEENQTAPESTIKYLDIAARTSTMFTATLAIQSPIRTIMVKMLGVPLSTLSMSTSLLDTGAFLGLRTLYAGTVSSAGSSLWRTCMVNGAREFTPEDATSRQNFWNKWVWTAVFAGIESALVQPLEYTSTLRKRGDLPPGFKVSSNIPQLMTGGVGWRYTSAVLNFYGTTNMSSYIANQLKISNDNLRVSTAGFISGIGAGYLSFPFALIKDKIQVGASFTAEGKLENIGSLKVLKELAKMTKASPKDFIKMLVIQSSFRAIQTGVTFSIFEIVNRLFEDKALKTSNNSYRYFNKPEIKPLNPEIEELNTEKAHSP